MHGNRCQYKRALKKSELNNRNRSDLWCTVPPKLAQKAFGITVDRTLDILTVRYLHVTPSAKRVDQFRGDVSAMLLMSSEVLLFLCGAVHQLFEPRTAPYGGSQVIFGVRLSSI
jgi:hypothetical protein